MFARIYAGLRAYDLMSKAGHVPALRPRRAAMLHYLEQRQRRV